MLRVRVPSIGLITAVAVFLAGCAHRPAPLSTTPTFEAKSPLEKPRQGPLVVGPGTGRQEVAPGPAPPATAPTAAGLAAALPLPQNAPAEALSLEQVSLPAFINEVFSKALKLTVQIDQAVASRTDLVTLRTGKPLPPKELFDDAVKILAGYGVGVSWDGSVLRVATDQSLMAQMPALIHSRALPEMPVALRPIFQVVNVNQISASDMLALLTNAYGTKVKLFLTPGSNTIMIFGLPANVRDVVEAVQVLDQARLAGRQSLRVSPVYWTARGLATKLVELLRAEGYDASASGVRSPTGGATAIMIVPVEANNSIVAFAADPAVLAHIRQWVADLDQPGQADPARTIFVYLVQNTTAASLGRVIQGVIGGTQAAISAPAAAQLEQAGRTQPLLQSNLQSGFNQPGASTPGTTPGSTTPSAILPPRTTQPLEETPVSPTPNPAAPGQQQPGLRLVVDAARNALVFVGTAQDYSRVRPLLEALDKAPREALIEVTVAEVDLSNSNNLGVEWTLVTPLGNGAHQRLGTGTNVLRPTPGTGGTAATPVGGLPIGTTGFNYTILNGVGDVRMVLNAFAQDNKISVLSTPRVLAESGGTANIQVGSEIPIITSQGTTNVIQSQGTSGILQSIEYRKTGVILAVRPVVHSGNRIDLDVSQEVSNDQGNCVPGISSPCIQNRNISTQLTLSDGQTVVIGGLISDTRNQNDSGVPYLKDIPGLGVFFKNQALSRDRTELLVFITPYVVSNETDAAAITEQFQDQMKNWPVPHTRLQF